MGLRLRNEVSRQLEAARKTDELGSQQGEMSWAARAKAADVGAAGGEQSPI